MAEKSRGWGNGLRLLHSVGSWKNAVCRDAVVKSIFSFFSIKLPFPIIGTLQSTAREGFLSQSAFLEGQYITEDGKERCAIANPAGK
ncbi:hypothetical protein SRHO_G00219240 [Serrasalmus rhombeus]